MKTINKIKSTVGKGFAVTVLLAILGAVSLAAVLTVSLYSSSAIEGSRSRGDLYVNYYLAEGCIEQGLLDLYDSASTFEEGVSVVNDNIGCSYQINKTNSNVYEILAMEEGESVPQVKVVASIEEKVEIISWEQI